MALRNRARRPRTPSAAPAENAGALARPNEKILLTLAVQTQQLNDRLTRLEERFEASLRDSLSQPDQQDLLELRLHSARVAAELSRVTIELRAEINELAASRGETIDLTELDPALPVDVPAISTLPHRRVDDLVAEPRERPASSPAARGRRTSGWKPTRQSAPIDNDR